MRKENIAKILFILLLVVSFFVTPAVALFLGILLSLTIGVPYSKLTKKVSKYLLQISVVGLGFGMNLHQSLQAGKEGMIFTIISVIGVM
ncbi:MAG: putative sulfate exporter family transporter, partial [Coprobacter sp.]|nr:putative sulfate exporter family transporter [Coprobacter sp.]